MNDSFVQRMMFYTRNNFYEWLLSSKDYILNSKETFMNGFFVPMMFYIFHSNNPMYFCVFDTSSEIMCDN